MAFGRILENKIKTIFSKYNLDNSIIDSIDLYSSVLPRAMETAKFISTNLSNKLPITRMLYIQELENILEKTVTNLPFNIETTNITNRTRSDCYAKLLNSIYDNQVQINEDIILGCYDKIVEFDSNDGDALGITFEISNHYFIITELECHHHTKCDSLQVNTIIYKIDNIILDTNKHTIKDVEDMFANRFQKPIRVVFRTGECNKFKNNNTNDWEKHLLELVNPQKLSVIVSHGKFIKNYILKKLFNPKHLSHPNNLDAYLIEYRVNDNKSIIHSSFIDKLELSPTDISNTETQFNTIKQNIEQLNQNLLNCKYHYQNDITPFCQ